MVLAGLDEGAADGCCSRWRHDRDDGPDRGAGDCKLESTTGSASEKTEHGLHGFELERTMVETWIASAASKCPIELGGLN